MKTNNITPVHSMNTRGKSLRSQASSQHRDELQVFTPTLTDATDVDPVLDSVAQTTDIGNDTCIHNANKYGSCLVKDHQCPVAGCGRIFCSTKNSRQALWKHLTSSSTRGLLQTPHKEAHGMKTRANKATGTIAERSRFYNAVYREKNLERSKTASRHGNFRARARKEGLAKDKIAARVEDLEQRWHARREAEAAKYFANILLEAMGMPNVSN